jgi:TatD DNase family protein
MQTVAAQKIEHLLCIAIDLDAYPAMVDLVKDYPNISLSVGVHPNVTVETQNLASLLLQLAEYEKVVAIGETGLDYFRSSGDLAWQQQRFRTHIQVAKAVNKPLIIHTREAGEDTLKLLAQEGADKVGGVIHCFTEDWDFAQQALALNFYISFSGIVTFKNAVQIQEAAKQVPADRFLIETDSPYLSPAPFRGKPNYPMYVQYVAQQLASVRNTTVEEIARQSSANFYALFGNALSPKAH